MCVRVRLYVCMCVHTFTCVCTYTYARLCVRVCVYTPVYVFVTRVRPTTRRTPHRERRYTYRGHYLGEGDPESRPPPDPDHVHGDTRRRLPGSYVVPVSCLGRSTGGLGVVLSLPPPTSPQPERDIEGEWRGSRRGVGGTPERRVEGL